MYSHFYIQIPFIIPTLLQLFLGPAKHSSWIMFSSNLQAHPSLFSFTVVPSPWWVLRFLLARCPSNLICCQGFAFHSWAPHFIFQTVLNFKIMALALLQDCGGISSCVSDSTDAHRNSLLPLHPRPNLAPQTGLPLTVLISFRGIHCVTSHTRLKPHTHPGLFFISHDFPSLVPLTYAHQITRFFQCYLLNVLSCFHFAVSTTTMKAFITSHWIIAMATCSPLLAQLYPLRPSVSDISKTRVWPPDHAHPWL